MRKIFSLLLCLLLLCASIPPVQAEEGDTNILRNSSFEANNGWFSNGAANVGLGSTESRTGNRSAQLTSTGNDVWLAQMLVPVYPNTPYEFSAYFLQKEAIQNGIWFKIEYYRDVECTQPLGTGVDSPYMEPKSDGNWHRFSYDFTVPAEIHGLVVFFRLNKTGTVYIDDASLCPTGQIPAFSLTTDHEIYYTEWGGNITASTKMYADAYPSLVDGTVKFQLLDGKTVLDNRAFSYGEMISYTVALNKLTKEKTPYTVKVTAYDKNGGEIYSDSVTVYRFDRPSMIDDDGNILVNNKPFVPVFFYYNTYTKEGIEREKEMGANTALIDNWMAPDPDMVEDTLDLLHENGMKAIVRLYYKMLPAGHANNVEIIETLVKRISVHPAVLGYILMDEPGGVLQYGYEGDLLNSYLLVRKFDSVHPTIINEAPYTAFEIAARYCDILSHDPYPGGSVAATNTYTSYVADGIQKAVQAVKGKKPVFAVLQAFDYLNFNPDAAQLRQMFYQALAAGAKGFGYFSQRPVWNTKLKDGLVSFASSEQAAALSAVNNSSLIKEDTSTSSVRMWHSSSDTYVLLLNLQKDVAANIQMHFWGEKSPSDYVLGNADGFSFQNSGEQHTFSIGAGGAILLKLPEGEATAHLLSDAFHVHMEDEAGSIISEISGGKNFTVSLAMGNTQSAIKSYFGTVALYAKIKDNQEELIKVFPFHPQVPAYSGTKPGQYRLDIPFDMNGQGTKTEYAVKVLLWTSAGGLIPTEIVGAGKAIG